jgi:hypothetical protein
MIWIYLQKGERRTQSCPALDIEDDKPPLFRRYSANKLQVRVLHEAVLNTVDGDCT